MRIRRERRWQPNVSNFVDPPPSLLLVRNKRLHAKGRRKSFGYAYSQTRIRPAYPPTSRNPHQGNASLRKSPGQLPRRKYQIPSKQPGRKGAYEFWTRCPQLDCGRFGMRERSRGWGRLWPTTLIHGNGTYRGQHGHEQHIFRQDTSFPRDLPSKRPRLTHINRSTFGLHSSTYQATY